MIYTQSQVSRQAPKCGVGDGTKASSASGVRGESFWQVLEDREGRWRTWNTYAAMGTWSPL